MEIDKTNIREQAGLERAYISRESFALANDIDKDGQADFLTSKVLGEENKIKLKEMDIELEREKLRAKIGQSRL